MFLMSCGPKHPNLNKHDDLIKEAEIWINRGRCEVSLVAVLKWKEGRCYCEYNADIFSLKSIQPVWTEVGLLRSLLLLMAKGPLRGKCNQPWIAHWYTEVGIHVRRRTKMQRCKTEKREMTPKTCGTTDQAFSNLPFQFPVTDDRRH